MQNGTSVPAALTSVTTLSYICAALVAAVLILAIVTVINLISLNRLKKRYEEFMYRKNRSGVTIESLLDECLAETRSVERGYSSVKSRLAALEAQIPNCFQKIGVVRYNPFDDTGGDLSYVVALLDENNSGFVLNGIYNRSGSYTYAKEIEKGIPVKHKLSAEEFQALQIAIGGAVNRFSDD